MSITKEKITRGIILKADDVGVEGIEGELKVGLTSKKLHAYLDGALRSVVTETQSQSLSNKAIDADTNTISNLEVDNLKPGVLNTDLSTPGTDLQIPSALAVQDAIADSSSGSAAALQAHIDSTTAHTAANLVNVPAGNLSATNLQAAVNELQTDIDTNASAISAHISNPTGAHAASAISNVPAGNLVATNIQDAVNELQTEIDTLSAGSTAALDAHILDTSTHGVTGDIVGTTDTQTLSNKTFTAPIVNSPEINTPSKLDVKQDTKANLITYALTATNGQIVFATDEKKMYQVVDTLLQPIGGGSQGLDIAFQLFAEEELADWDTTAIMGGTFVKETVAPFNGDASYKFTRSNSSSTAIIVSPAQDVALRFRGQTCTLYFPYSYTGLNGIVTAQLYDNTNSALIDGVIPLNGTNGGIVVAKTNVTIPLTCTSVGVVFTFTGADNGAILQFDDIQLTSDTTVYGLVDRGNVGEILAFAGSVAPTGFIACNGAAVSRSQYNELFKVIGITHGQGDGSTTFNLPDYRGRFLRGVANGSTNDPDRASRTAMATGGNTGDNVGSVQADELKSHTHNIGAGVDDGAASFVDRATNLQVNIPTAATGGSETRPINAYVNYYIRYSETSTNILTAPDTFSTDTAPLNWGAGTYNLSTLSNAPIGTYIVFEYSANTNTRVQNTVSRPTQTDADMNVNGIRLFTRAYNAASNGSSPACIAIQIGKGMKGVSTNLYASAGKVTAGNLDFNTISTTNHQGARVKDYNEVTGILIVDSGNAALTTNTSATFQFSDNTSANNGYLVINASKNPALTGLNIGTVAARYVSSNGQAIGTTSALLTYETKKYDTHSAYNSGIFVVPESGYYDIKASLLTATVTLANTAGVQLVIRINGVDEKAVISRATGGNTTYYASVQDTIFLTKGETISVYGSATSATTMNTSSIYNTLTITKVSVG